MKKSSKIATVDQFNSTDRAVFYETTKEVAKSLYEKYLGGIFVYDGNEFVLVGYRSADPSWKRNPTAHTRPRYLFYSTSTHERRQNEVIEDYGELEITDHKFDPDKPKFRILVLGREDVNFTGKYHKDIRTFKENKLQEEFDIDKKYAHSQGFISRWAGIDLIYKTNKYSNLKGRKYKVRLVGVLNDSWLVHFDPTLSLSSMRFEDYSNRLSYDGGIRSIKETGYWAVSIDELVGPANALRVTLG